jgi:YidC/Oxa1 family membrane protein insertase
MQNNRNFFITIALSVLILTLWQVFYMNPRIEAQRETAKIEASRVEANKPADTASPTSNAPAATQPGAIPTAPGTDQPTAEGRDQALAASGRVKIDTPSLEGSINLTGARLDDLSLKH